MVVGPRIPRRIIGRIRFLSWKIAEKSYRDSTNRVQAEIQRVKSTRTQSSPAQSNRTQSVPIHSNLSQLDPFQSNGNQSKSNPMDSNPFGSKPMDSNQVGSIPFRLQVLTPVPCGGRFLQNGRTEPFRAKYYKIKLFVDFRFQDNKEGTGLIYF